MSKTFSYRLHNGRGLSVNIDIYKDGVYTGMKKTVRMRQEDAEKYAQRLIDDLNMEVRT